MTIQLIAKARTLLGKKAKTLRTKEEIPAVLYGHGLENKNLTIGYNQFEKVFKTAGENTIIDLVIDDQAPVKVLVADVQVDPIKNRFAHIDFKQIRMDEKIVATVKLNFIGEAAPVKEEGGVFVHNFSELEIRCLPGDLIHEINVDISRLKTFNDVIKIKDLNLPANIETTEHEAEEVVATVARPKKIEEEAPVQAAAPVEGASTEAGETGENKSAGAANADKKE